MANPPASLRLAVAPATLARGGRTDRQQKDEGPSDGFGKKKVLSGRVYYFKKASDEFECGAVFEEVSDDGTLLPTYEGKILGKVERME
ncbi:hypothetical protein CRUP_017874 [Coryphaenoides rupestris]|nr:hypothetical protein CRUP_017874 [Coryphaenoides rupestris]